MGYHDWQRRFAQMLCVSWNMEDYGRALATQGPRLPAPVLNSERVVRMSIIIIKSRAQRDSYFTFLAHLPSLHIIKLALVEGR